MAENIKFKCLCGKLLGADVKFAGKKAKCTNCGQLIIIPTPKATITPIPAAAANAPVAAPPKAPAVSRPISPPTKPAPPPAPSPEKSIWDEEGDYELEHPPAPTPDPLATASEPAATTKTKKAARPAWHYFAAFGVYILVAWIISLFSTGFFLFISMPVCVFGGLIFMFGALWYFAVSVRDHPGEASVMFFGLIFAMLLGIRGSSVGRMTGRMRRGRAANPSHRRPVAVMKFGAGLGSFGLGAVLIVGMLFGAIHRHKFGIETFGDPLNRPMPHPQAPPGPPMQFHRMN